MSEGAAMTSGFVLPDVEDEREAMERMPRARLRSVKDVFVQHHDEILIFTVFPLIYNIGRAYSP